VRTKLATFSGLAALAAAALVSTSVSATEGELPTVDSPPGAAKVITEAVRGQGNYDVPIGVGHEVFTVNVVCVGGGDFTLTLAGESDPTPYTCDGLQWHLTFATKGTEQLARLSAPADSHWQVVAFEGHGPTVELEPIG
jgi:hypothetical protein